MALARLRNPRSASSHPYRPPCRSFTLPRIVLCVRLFALPFLLCPSTLMHPPDRRIPFSHPRTVDSPLKWNVIIGLCVIIALSPFWQLHNSYRHQASVCMRNSAHIHFFTFHPDIVRRYKRRFLSDYVRFECAAIERVLLVDPAVPSRSKLTIKIGFSTTRYRECEIFLVLHLAG